jgi:hypothetical protein
MGAVVDAVSSSGGGTASVTTKSWTHTPVGTPTAASVGVEHGGSATVTVTYGGQAMTEPPESPVVNATSDDRGHIFELLNPPAGPQTVVVTLSAAEQFEAAAITYTGAFSFGTPVKATGNTTVAAATVACAAGDIVVDSYVQATVATPTSTQTARYGEAFGPAATNNIGAGSTAPGGASVVMGYTITSAVQWAIIAVAIGARQNEALMVMSEGA